MDISNSDFGAAVSLHDFLQYFLHHAIAIKQGNVDKSSDPQFLFAEWV